MKTNVIVTYIEYKIHMNFYMRFCPSLKNMGYKFIFITNKLSLKFFLQKKKCEVLLVKSSRKVYDLDTSQTIEVKTNEITHQQSLILYSAVYEQIEKISEKWDIKFFFIFNGEKVSDLAIKNFANRYNIKTIFFELANIKNKIFVDPVGTNAHSSLYKNINILKQFNVSEEKFINWRTMYFDQLQKSVLPKQATLLSKINNHLLFVDEVGHAFMKIPHNKRENLLRKLYEKSISNRKIINIDFKYKLNESNYVFFPTQVSDDTQLKIHSNIGNIEGIRYAYEKSKDLGKLLVVKIHPAENSNVEIKEILDLKEQLGFKIINANIYQLVNNASMIITINSSVGLIGLLLGKNVSFLGRTFLEYFDNKELLKNYIIRYLIPIDFFSNEYILEEVVKEVLKRGEQQYIE